MPVVQPTCLVKARVNTGRGSRNARVVELLSLDTVALAACHGFASSRSQPAHVLSARMDAKRCSQTALTYSASRTPHWVRDRDLRHISDASAEAVAALIHHI